MTNMGGELSNRLIAEGFKGRHLTLKVMTRHPTAPIHPPKFLGHGPCDTHTKTWTMPTATDSGAMIGELAWKLLRSLQFDPKELRGLALQMQKLEGDGASVDVEQGQSLLSFASSRKNSSGNDPVGELLKAAADPGRERPVVVETSKNGAGGASRLQPERAAKSRAVLLPTASQIDVEVFDELPDDVKAELPYAKNSQGRLLPTSRRQQSSEPSSMKQPSIKKSATSTKPFAKQVKLKRKGQLGLRAVPPPPRADSPPSPSRITARQLQSMSMDVDAFRGLPRDIQIEVLSDAWNKMEKSWRVAQKEGERSRSVSVQVADKNKAQSGVVVVVNRTPKIFGRVDLEEIRDALEIWMEAKADEGPFSGDIDHLAGGIVDTLSSTRGRDLAKASAILTWWKILIDERFGGELEGGVVGVEWKEAFEKVRDRVDKVVRTEYGGVLSLSL
jgi:DNA repair protein REV1